MAEADQPGLADYRSFSARLRREPGRRRREPDGTHRDDQTFEKGAGIGRFLLGSSVVLAFENDRVRLRETLAAGTVVRMGEAIGTAG